MSIKIVTIGLHAMFIKRYLLEMFLLCTLMVGCAESPQAVTEAELVGTWVVNTADYSHALYAYDKDFTIQLNADKTCELIFKTRLELFYKEGIENDWPIINSPVNGTWELTKHQWISISFQGPRGIVVGICGPVTRYGNIALKFSDGDSGRIHFIEKRNIPDLEMEKFSKKWEHSRKEKRYPMYMRSGTSGYKKYTSLTSSTKDKGELFWNLCYSIRQLEIAVDLAVDKETKEKTQCALVKNYSLTGKWLLENGSADERMLRTAEAKRMLQAGKDLIAELLKKSPDNGAFHYANAVNAFCRKDYPFAVREIAEAERCSFQIDPKFKVEVENNLKASSP